MSNKSPLKVVLLSLLILGVNAGLIYIFGFYTYLKLAFEPVLVKANYYEFFVFSFSVLIIELGVFFLTRKTRKKLAKSLLIALTPVYILIGIGSIQFIQFLNPTEFNETVWRKEIRKPTEMARSLLWNKSLEGLSKEEVLQKLGKDFSEKHSNHSKFTYHLTASSIAYFVIDFEESDTVKRVYFTYWDD